jgi:hypothetical protein
VRSRLDEAARRDGSGYDVTLGSGQVELNSNGMELYTRGFPTTTQSVKRRRTQATRIASPARTGNDPSHSGQCMTQ